MKKVLCTFANHFITRGFPRFKEQAESMDVFDEIIFYSQKDLGKDFRAKYGRHLYPYSRGFGYWSWKPYLILKALELLEEGDILLYTDLGCFFNPNGRKRMMEYYDMVEKSPIGILGFRSYEKSYNGMPENTYYEYQFTKGDILDYFGVRNDESYTQTTQFEAGIIFIRKNPQSVLFFKEWLDAIYADTSLITDQPSRSPNLEGFVENRHDQSLYSILAKKHKIAEVSTNELFPIGQNWDLLTDYPIWAMRDMHYPSKFHYLHRLRFRQLYNALWSLKYLFKSKS
ncbi:hypothetical protein [Dysgonomonas sp. 25]|uniref:hypothetical protein n=1 Tax=Dysgonomonas sp. 25 TaxID=2302933 RepID=UPI0013D5A12C|nr:hypothetical protein [Dysgonomonas sp. 25]NDV69777.1 hypothetical protein [Dysgonomonas sp. 25]